MEELRILNNYLIVQVCVGLEKIGFFEEAARRPRTIQDLAHALGVNENLLRASVEFLWVTTSLLHKDGDLVALRDPEKTAGISWMLGLTLAYKSVLDAIPELLRGEKIYGRDLTRDGFYVQKWSSAITAPTIARALRATAAMPRTVLADLGCGSADSLLFFCRANSGARGVGIDIDPSTVSAAKRRIKQHGLAEQISIVHADLVDIPRWRSHLPEQENVVFFASAVLHEFLRSGEEFVVDFLARLRTTFPRARLVVIETDAPFAETLKTTTDVVRKLAIASYVLLHPFSGQGRPQPREKWEELITRSGWTIFRIDPPLPPTHLVTFHCRGTDWHAPAPHG